MFSHFDTILMCDKHTDGQYTTTANTTLA